MCSSQSHPLTLSETRAALIEYRKDDPPSKACQVRRASISASCTLCAKKVSTIVDRPLVLCPFHFRFKPSSQSSFAPLTCVTPLWPAQPSAQPYPASHPPASMLSQHLRPRSSRTFPLTVQFFINVITLPSLPQSLSFCSSSHRSCQSDSFAFPPHLLVCSKVSNSTYQAARM